MRSEASDPRPRLLIVSFSDIEIDARVRRQIELFAADYRVTTCGYGDSFFSSVEHIRIAQRRSRWRQLAQAVLLKLRLSRAAFWFEPDVHSAARALRGRRFDAAIANDLESIAVASRFSTLSSTHADLHEYWPGLHDHVPAWARLRKPYFEWMLRTFAAKAASSTTVSQAIADRYESEYGIACGVVMNAGDQMQLRPTPVSQPIRLVHSGVAQPNRRLEVMMRAAASTVADVTLDLYLTQETTPYAAELRRLAADLGNRITVHPPVPYRELVGLLNRYDVGVFVLPPTSTNYALALPNKFFDFVQARLGIIIGPSADMSRLLRKYELGAVAADYDLAATTEVFDALSSETVAKWKQHSDAAAADLNFATQSGTWLDAIRKLVSQ